MMPRTETHPQTTRRVRVQPMHVEEFVDSLFGEDLHAKRVLFLSNATIGVLGAAALGVHAIGLALAQERGLSEKHAVKQVDRFMSNRHIDPWELAAQWVPFVIGARKEIIAAMDWTDFDADDQSTLMIALVTSHGRRRRYCGRPTASRRSAIIATSTRTTCCYGSVKSCRRT